MSHPLVQRITSVSTFLASQRLLVEGEAFVASMGAMTQSLLAQIGTFQVSIADATSVNAAITGSIFAGDQKAALAAAVASRLTMTGDAADAQVRPRRQQTQSMVWPQNYLTQSEWDHLASAATCLQACQVLTDRLRHCGLHCPSE